MSAFLFYPIALAWALSSYPQYPVDFLPHSAGISRPHSPPFAVLCCWLGDFSTDQLQGQRGQRRHLFEAYGENDEKP